MLCCHSILKGDKYVNRCLLRSLLSSYNVFPHPYCYSSSELQALRYENVSKISVDEWNQRKSVPRHLCQNSNYTLAWFITINVDRGYRDHEHCLIVPRFLNSITHRHTHTQRMWAAQPGVETWLSLIVLEDTVTFCVCVAHCMSPKLYSTTHWAVTQTSSDLTVKSHAVETRVSDLSQTIPYF